MWAIKNAPDWVIAGDERYTIQAKAEDPASTEQQLLQMLQSLLANRFQLRFHREAKDMPGLALTVGKKCAKLKQTASPDTGVSPFALKPKLGPGQPITVALRRYSMQKLVEFLSNIYLAPMVDETRLTGLYDIDLSWDESSRNRRRRATRSSFDAAEDPSFVFHVRIGPKAHGKLAASCGLIGEEP
jgi:uncharacterized protein (TIGR03435 family)